jgi:hypothetical protein
VVLASLAFLAMACRRDGRGLHPRPEMASFFQLSTKLTTERLLRSRSHKMSLIVDIHVFASVLDWRKMLRHRALRAHHREVTARS